MPRPPIDPPRHDTGPVPHLQRPARDCIPHTTHKKASLYLVIAPPLEALADELNQLNRKTAGLVAEPQVVAQAAALLRDVRRLLRGEPGAHLADLDFTPPVRVQALALGLRQLASAVAGFRDRYYGYNPLTDCPAWAVADPFGNPDPRWLGRPGSVERTIGELNLMTAEVLRSHLLGLAQRSGTPVPADLKRREEEPEKPAAKKDDDAPNRPNSKPAVSAWRQSNARRRLDRFVRSKVRRSRPKRPAS